MTRLLTLTLMTALAVTACGTAASDVTDTPAGSSGETAAFTPDAAERRAPRFVTVTIPAGTALPLSLTGSVASDTSGVEDAVAAELTRAIAIDGRDVLAAGTRVTGVVSRADDSGRVKGRANVTLAFTAIHVGGRQYDVASAPSSHTAPTTKAEDATKIGVGAGAGAIIGGLLGGKDGAAKGAAVGGGAGTGVVLATKGKEMRLGPGADVSTRLTAPLIVRVKAG
jgi:hypothetical protein